jgi:hypothetical protein
MAKTYNTISTFTAGQVLTAAEMNDLGENSNNYRVPPMGLFTAAQSVADGSNQPVTLTENVDTDGMFTSGTTITIATAGVYLISGFANWSATANVRADAWIQHSSAGTLARDTRYGTVESNAFSVAYDCSAADTLVMYLYQDNTSSASRTANATLSVIWQGQAS